MKSIILVTALLVFSSCSKNQNELNKVEVSTTGSKVDSSEPKDFDLNNFGSYVDESYKDRQNGNDWVSVTVLPLNEKQVSISVRSRADQKQPTCTYNGSADVVDANTLTVQGMGGKIFFAFSYNTLHISAAQGSAPSTLSYYCRGGATLEGAYSKLDENLDAIQIDKREYVATVPVPQSQAVFYIEQKGKELVVTPSSFQITNVAIPLTIEGKVVNAYMTDLIGDGLSELIIILSNGSERYGNVIAFNSRNGKAVTPINFPDLRSDKKLSEGYRGKDEFKVEGGKLIRTFPVYKPTDTNNSTGGIRTIVYELKNKDVSWDLEVVSSNNY